MNPVTVVFPYYEAPRMLGMQLLNMAGYSRAVKEALTLIVVDDGSPMCPAYDVMGSCRGGIKCRLYRIRQDIPWNAHGARNLGFMEADEGAWVFGLDVKHLIPAACMDWLVFGKWKPQEGRFYTFPYVKFQQGPDGKVDMSLAKDGNGYPTKPHPNTFLAQRETFWAAGGYNEDFTGTYGGDGEFMRRLKAVADEVNLAPDFWVVRVDRTIVPDSMAMVESRSYFKALYSKAVTFHKRPVNPLRFEWTRLL